MSILTINTLAAPAPTSLQVGLEDAQLSVQTTLSGKTHISRAAAKRRISVYWAYMSPQSLKELLTEVTQSPTCSLTFPDPMTGESTQITVYSAQRSVGLYRMQNGVPVWTNVEMTFMES